jgi:hypothetical protein
MADEVRFAYRVQLPDGSQTIRTGGAAQPPTMGQLADYAANKGERFLGPVDMSPAPPPPEPAATAAPPPAPTVAPAAAPREPVPVLPSAVVPVSGTAPTPPLAPPPSPPPASSVGAELRGTFLPRRSFTSELPSIAGATIAGGVTAPFAPWGAIPAAGAGSALGEAGLIGTEKLMGWPPAEPGTLAERTRRAYVRGATGEGLARAVTLGGRAAISAVRGPFEAAEQLGPVLTRTVPAETTLVHAPEGLSGAVRAVPIDDVVKDPLTALKGVTVTPELQQSILGRWWQTTAEGGPKNVVKAWDALKESGQQAIAGDKLDAMTTVVNTLRASAEPLMSAGTVGRAVLTGGPLSYYGASHPVSLAAAASEEVLRRGAPRLFLYPRSAGFIANLPKIGRVASPWAGGLLRGGTQVGVAKAYRPPAPEEP